jgi:CHAT domain-containing protein
LWRQQNDIPQQAETLIDLGYLEYKKGEWPKTIDYYTQAQGLIGEMGPPLTLARIASGLAATFIESGIPQSALTQYQRALDYYRQAEEERASQRLTMLIGHTYYLLHDDAAALANLQQALSDFKPNSPDAAECYEYLAQLHLSKGEFARALLHLTSSLQIFEEAENPIEAARVRVLMGQAYEQQSMVERARTRYEQALKTFRNVKDRVSEAAVSFALGRLELKEGHLDKAENYLRQSVENTEEIRSVNVGRDIATAFSASVHKRYAVYIDCLLRKHKLRPASRLDIQAFEASELARARSLAEFLRDTHTDVLTGVDPALAEQEKNLRQLIRAKIDFRTELLASDYAQKELKEIEDSLVQLREQQQQLTEKIRSLSPSHEQITRPSSYSLSEIQSRVIENDETALVEYLLGETTSYAWVVTKNSIDVFELSNEAQIEEAVGKVYQLLRQRPVADSGDQLNEAAAQLSKLILAPLADKLQARRLIVVADGALNYIPFQFLPHPAEGQPLIASYEIVNVPSASILGQLRHGRRSPSKRDKVLVAFGDPFFPKSQSTTLNASREIRISGDALDPSKLQSLLYAKHELNALEKIAGAQSFIVSGYEATRETFEKTDLSRYAVLHLATHGIFDPKKPEASGFCLSMVDANERPLNGFITTQDVYSLQVPVDLVVLSACQTALGKDVRGEGLIGLTRGFMHAGASSVAASLWSVDDEATAELMKKFYSNMLHDRMAPAAALRAAQNDIRQNPLWQSPHFWAAFTLQGEYRDPITIPAIKDEPKTIRTVVTIFVILTLLAAIGWLYRRRRAATKT